MLRRARKCGLSRRPITPQDEPFLQALYAEVRAYEFAHTGMDAAQVEALLKMQFAFQHKYYHDEYPDARYDLILLKKKPVGRLYLHRRDAEHRILDLALLKAYQRQGKGGALLRDLMDEAAQVGKPLSVYVEGYNPSLPFFEHLGFEKTGEHGVHHLMTWQPAARPRATGEVQQ